jgi:hypothetical protein
LIRHVSIMLKAGCSSIKEMFRRSATARSDVVELCRSVRPGLSNACVASCASSKSQSANGSFLSRGFENATGICLVIHVNTQR